MHDLIKVTEVDGTASPRVYTSQDTAKKCFPLSSRPQNLRHLLAINMRPAHIPLKTSDDDDDMDGSLTWEAVLQRREEDFNSYHPVILENLRTVVSKDSTDPSRIDFVRFEGLNHREAPCASTWHALDGLLPRHLELKCGWDEHCDLSPLDELETKWPLESLTLTDACATPLSASCLGNISSLTLYFCSGVTISPSYNAGRALRRLRIEGNNVIDMFIGMSKRGIVDSVEEVRISNTNGGEEEYESSEFFEVLPRHTSIRSFDLAVSLRPHDPCYHALPLHLPPNIEHLRFRGPPETAGDLSNWLKCAKDPGWLPHLKTFSFHLDVELSDDRICKIYQGYPPPRPLTTEDRGRVQELLDAALQHHTGLRLVD
ncbi:hypothetical protein EW146_g3322 [Bondarzewia mesenterica]|uniref:Uncharacterized protein n=1 Tax=Bondarzewia mesenterica TaxID=1095465 RepID=A0A4S4LYC3_9AGAM|nr:hypothetical protein EW146_g3322 [Bondarzewia mesenterica]